MKTVPHFSKVNCVIGNTKEQGEEWLLIGRCVQGHRLNLIAFNTLTFCVTVRQMVK